VNILATLTTSFELVFLFNVEHADTSNIRCNLRQASQITHPSSELLSAGQYVEKEKELPTKPPGLNT
jgi:hypothetical protein